MQDKEYTPILIRTKLHRPPLPVCMVKRPRLTGWLPAPAGPFYLVLRIYWPEQAALDGTWTPPPVKQSN
jgi:hypothetical protein